MPCGLEVFPSPAPPECTAPLTGEQERAITPTQLPPPASPPLPPPHTLPFLLQRGPETKKRKRRPQERRGNLGPWAEMARDPLLAERRRLYERQHAQEMAAVDIAKPVVMVPMEEEEGGEEEEAVGRDDAFAGALPFPHAPTWDKEPTLR